MSRGELSCTCQAQGPASRGTRMAVSLVTPLWRHRGHFSLCDRRHPKEIGNTHCLWEVTLRRRPFVTVRLSVRSVGCFDGQLLSSSEGRVPEPGKVHPVSV